MFRKGETLRVAGGQKGLVVVAVCPCRNKRVLFKFLNNGNFLTLTVFRPLKSCGGEWMVIRLTHKKTARAGNVTSLIANHMTEFKISYFWTD
jgi:hypothetical protein